MSTSLHTLLYEHIVTYPALEAELQEHPYHDEHIIGADEHVPKVHELQLLPEWQHAVVLGPEEGNALLPMYSNIIRTHFHKK